MKLTKITVIITIIILFFILIWKISVQTGHDIQPYYNQIYGLKGQ